MQVQLNTQKMAASPEWQAMVKPFEFTPKQTDQFVTNFVRHISQQMKRSCNRMIQVYKEMKRREQSRN